MATKASWDVTSTTALIESMKTREAIKLRELNVVSCADLFAAVQGDLMEHGFEFSIPQIRNKWKKLKQHYYTKCELLRRMPAAGSKIQKWRYFKTMHELLQGKVIKRAGGTVIKLPSFNSSNTNSMESDQAGIGTSASKSMRSPVTITEITIDEEELESSEEELPTINGEPASTRRLVQKHVPDQVCLSLGNSARQNIQSEDLAPSTADDGVVAALEALTNTIKEERRKDRQVAREDRQAFVAALNNVASAIQNSSRDMIDALQSSLA